MMEQHPGRSTWTAAEPQRSLWQQHWQRIIALLCWLALVGSYHGYAWRSDLSPAQVLAQIISLLQAHMLGPIVFIAIYALRPLMLFPATLLTLGAGLVFGPLPGIVYAVIGSNLSALLALLIGRVLGDGVLYPARNGAVQRYVGRLRRNSFETVLIMRCAFLPYDLVNYVCGVLRIDWKAFLLATAIGSLPGTIAIVLAGAAITGELMHGLPGFDARIFAASVALLIVSLAIARIVKRRERDAVQ